MKKIFFFCLLIFLYFDLLAANTLRGGYPGCVTKKLYEQFMTAYMQSQTSECEYLLKNGCFFPPAGLKISILEQSALTARAKVRVFLQQDAVILWTHYKNINRERNGD
jgi:hypothetical protein